MVEYNTIIIGAGISGISCAIYLKRAGISVRIFENQLFGGQLNRASLIENYPGYVSVMGSDLAFSLMEQLNHYQVETDTDDIMEIDYDNHIVKTKNNQYHYQFLVIATGRRERKLGLLHEEELLGHGISLCATCDGALYKEKEVIVIGGGNSAVSEALYLAKICKKVYLIYRSDHLRAEEILKLRLEERSNIVVYYHVNVLSYMIKDGNVEGVVLDNGEKVRASCVFLAIGHVPNSELFPLEKDNGYIVVDSNYQTSISHVYACGDVIKKELYQLVTASNEGVMVAFHIINNNSD